MHPIIRSLLLATIIITFGTTVWAQGHFKYMSSTLIEKIQFDDSLSTKKNRTSVSIYPRYNTADSWLAEGRLRFQHSNGFAAEIQPAFSFRDKNLKGTYTAKYKLDLARGGSIQPYVQLRSYGFEYNEQNGYLLNYRRIATGVTWQNENEERLWQGGINSRYINVDRANFSGTNYDIIQEDFVAIGMHITRKLKDESYPRALTITLDGVPKYNEDNSFAKISGKLSQQFVNSKNRGITIDLWGTYFLHNTHREVLSAGNRLVKGSEGLLFTPSNDYAYDLLYVDRNEGTVQQVYDASGGFTNRTGGNSRSIGQTNHLAYSASINADFPFSSKYFPLKAYFDIGQYYQYEIGKPQANTLFTGGLRLSYFNDLIKIQCPLIYSDQFSSIYRELGYNLLEKITIQIDFSRVYIDLLKI